jgi:Arc/MetJ family transcription regulator
LSFSIDVYKINIIYTFEIPMRTNIEIDDELLSTAMTATGLPTKKATVEEGLKLLVRIKGQVEALEDMKSLGWKGNLAAMRSGRHPGRRR